MPERRFPPPWSADGKPIQWVFLISLIIVGVMWVAGVAVDITEELLALGPIVKSWAASWLH